MIVRERFGLVTLPEDALTAVGKRLDIPKRREAATESLGRRRPLLFDFG